MVTRRDPVPGRQVPGSIDHPIDREMQAQPDFDVFGLAESRAEPPLALPPAKRTVGDRVDCLPENHRGLCRTILETIGLQRAWDGAVGEDHGSVVRQLVEGVVTVLRAGPGPMWLTEVEVAGTGGACSIHPDRATEVSEKVCSGMARLQNWPGDDCAS